MNFAIPPGTRLSQLSADQDTRLFDRGRAQDAGVAAVVAKLIADVRARGDDALREQARRFDGVESLHIEVPRSEWQGALDALDAQVRAGLEQAAGNIATFHRAQLPTVLEVEVEPGVLLGRRADPLQRVAVYAPGGRAAYPSSVLMGVVPARVAGVGEVVVCSPAGPDGRPPATVLAACAIGNADRLFAIGGAGAIAAAAYGTATVARVDKIVGPGNAYVTEAKRQVTGVVAIDCPAGPSEVLVIADDSANAEFVAYELFAQAEHDPDAASVLVSTSRELIEQVAGMIDREIASQPRRDVIRAALAARGALLLATDEAEMLSFSTRYAPEHVTLYVRAPRAALARTFNAGTVFLGNATSVAFGDYLTGANHVLPTAALARSYSGLSIFDFIRWTTYQQVAAGAAARLAGPTAVLADAEGLPAHARAARLRIAGGA
ncbi:MAG TPA: histidinol dehydrogenase [Longimicrobiales bacterium]